jgi:choline dehydrogenase-like flavoprotein
MNGTEFEYVIVGDGSAGGVLAGRLSADARVTVCLIEAGPHDGICRVSLATALMVPGKWRNWAFLTEPQPGLNGRRGYQPRGRILGGSRPDHHDCEKKPSTCCAPPEAPAARRSRRALRCAMK